MFIENGQTILFTGDSITDCHRSRLVGEGLGLGGGYVSLLNSMLAAGIPDKSIRVLNTGVGGDRVIDLESRWDKDVLDLHPDCLSVMIGINDVWRQFDSPELLQVDIDMYERVYRRLLTNLQPGIKRLVLMSPFLIEVDLSDPMRSMMDLYGGVVSKMALEFDAVFVDVQKAFDSYLHFRTGASLSDDRVHPNQTGHTIIANAFLSSVGIFDPVSGTHSREKR